MNKYSPYKIFKHPTKLQAIERGVITAPLCVRVKPTNLCQHKCDWCVYNQKVANMHETCNRKDYIPYPKLREIFKDFFDVGVRAVILSGGGEPLIHPQTKDILDDLRFFGFDWAIITNGQNILKHISELSHAKWVRVSADYWDASSFSLSRQLDGRKLHEILDGIKALSETDCCVSVNFVITHENVYHLTEATELFYSHGAGNIRFSPVWIKNFQEYHDHIQSFAIRGIKTAQEMYGNDFVYSSYRLTDQLDYRTYHQCIMSQVVPSIGADLGVYRCHNSSYTEHGLIGSLQNTSFKDLWFSETAQANMLLFDPSLHCNHQCANDSRNKIILEYLNSSTDYFI